MEILTVLVLLSLAGSLVFMNVGASMTNRRNQDFSQRMTALLKKARRMSVEDGAPKAFQISSSQRQCRVDGCNQPLDFPEHLGVEGEGIRQLNEDVFAIYFYPDGSSDGGMMTLTDHEKPVLRLRVDRLTGAIRQIESEG